MYDISKIVNKYLRDAAVISDIDNNVWTPGEYGWSEVE